MPIREFACTQGHVSEELFFQREPTPDAIECRVCGEDANIIPSVTAFTPGKWGDSTAKYDRGLGCVVNNSQHRDKIMADRGLVHESDMAHGYADDKVQKMQDESDQHDKDMAQVHDNFKSNGGDMGKAFADTFTAERICPEHFTA